MHDMKSSTSEDQSAGSTGPWAQAQGGELRVGSLPGWATESSMELFNNTEDKF